MPRYRLLITDLTDYGDLRCVAGWDLDRGKMIRPEPRPGAFWQGAATGAGQAFFPGQVVRFDADVPNPPTEYPHRTEDHVVQGDVHLIERLAGEDFRNHLENIADDAAAVLGSPVEIANGKAYVPLGTNHRSLVGINVARTELTFWEDQYGEEPPKLRGLLATQALSLNLSITSSDLRDRYRTGGLASVSEHFADGERLHVRLGLARAFEAQPNRCYMQINGIYILE